MIKAQILMYKPVYLGLPIIKLNKVVLYEFRYDYVKSNYGEKAKLCYMHKDSFIVYLKTDDIYKDIVEDVEIRFDTSKYELDRPLSKEKNKNVIKIMKEELGRKIMKEFFGLRAKTYSSLIDGGSEDKKAKGAKKFVIKRKLNFENHKNCLEGTQLKSKINYLEKMKLIYIFLKMIIKDS